MKAQPVTLLVLLATVLMLGGCDAISGKPGILGTWEADDSPGSTIEFRTDGTVMMTQDGKASPTLDYAVDESTSPITLTIDGKAGSMECADQDHVTFTNPDGETHSFHRLK